MPSMLFSRSSHLLLLTLPWLLPACGGGGGDGEFPLPTDLIYLGMDPPETEAERAEVLDRASARVLYSQGPPREYPLEYHTLFYPHQDFAGYPVGGVVDAVGAPLYDSSLEGQIVPFIADSPDGNTLLKIKDTPADQLHLLTQYTGLTTDYRGYLEGEAQGENLWGRLPMPVSLLLLKQSAVNGEFSITDSRRVDLSEINGLWQPAGAVITPWDTHLGTELNPPDAPAWEDNPDPGEPDTAALHAFLASYFEDPDKFGATAPYYYGYLPEITVFDNASSEVVKHYAMGRLSRRQVAIMPDRRTVYMGGDTAYTPLLMFVADAEDKLESGSLYAARWDQWSDEKLGQIDGGKADLTWVYLGAGSDQGIVGLLEEGVGFSDLFALIDADQLEDTEESYTPVRLARDEKVEYLRAREGMGETAAPFLETRRYAALQGATVEFSRLTGLALDPENKRLYLASAEVDDGMLGVLSEDGAGNQERSVVPADHIRVEKIRAGLVYVLSLEAGQKDAARKEIASDYVAVQIRAVPELVGRDLPRANERGETADPGRVADPAQLRFEAETGTLYVCEAGETRDNPFVWAYHAASGDLARLLSLPAGSACGGLQVIRDLNGFSYLWVSYRHPRREDELDPAMRRGGVGYVILPEI